jgi:hypothetical protein
MKPQEDAGSLPNHLLHVLSPLMAATAIKAGRSLSRGALNEKIG